MPYFCHETAVFGGFEGVFSHIDDKSAILCCVTAKVADFVSFKGSIVQGLNKLKQYILLTICLLTSFETYAIIIMNSCMHFARRCWA